MGYQLDFNEVKSIFIYSSIISVFSSSIFKIQKRLIKSSDTLVFVWFGSIFLTTF